jgi:3-oxoacyl-[acyl-carrier-protein] synthase-3
MENNIGIAAIGTYIPEGFVSNLDKLDLFEIDSSFLTNKIGTLKLSRKDSTQDTSDLCVKAFENLITKTNIVTSDIDCVVLVTQNPDGDGLPHTSSIIHNKLNLSENCAVFDISLGCSGFVYSLSVIQAFMNSNGMTQGLLFTCDPYSKIIDDKDKNTSLLFGDAATVTLINTNPVFKSLSFKFGSRGSDGESLTSVNKLLTMDGRAVFNFSATVVPVQIQGILEQNNMDIDSVDLFMFHQGSKFIVDTLTKRLGLDPKKVPSNLDGVGNTVSSSLPLLLSEYIEKENIKTVLLSGFGVGLSWASTILKRNISN